MGNRVLKFRAWDKSNKIMHYDFQFIKSGNEDNDWIVFTSDKQKLTDKPHPFENPFFEKQFEVTEFTGLKDKNGNDIYEGDILRNENTINVGVVIYNHHGCYFNVTDNYPDTLYNCDLINEPGDGWMQHEINVIGNIYENPNLF